MAQLATVSQVLSSMGMDLKHEGQLSDAVVSAISKATVRLEAFLGTRVELHQTTDWFAPNTDLMCGLTEGGLMKLRLSHGLLKVSPVVEVSIADRWDTPYSVITSGYLLNYRDGLLMLDEQYDKMVARVAYRHGFESEVDVDPTIHAALLAMVPKSLQVAQTTTATSDNEKAYTDHDKFAKELLAPLQRLFTNSYRPIHTVTEKVDA